MKRERAWAELAQLLMEEIARLRDHIEKRHGEKLPYPSAEVVARFRALHDVTGPDRVIERLVDA